MWSKIVAWFKRLSMNRTKKKVLKLLNSIDLDRDGITEGVKKEISDIFMNKVVSERNIDWLANHIAEKLMTIIEKKVGELQ